MNTEATVRLVREMRAALEAANHQLDFWQQTYSAAMKAEHRSLPLIKPSESSIEQVKAALASFEEWTRP